MTYKTYRGDRRGRDEQKIICDSKFWLLWTKTLWKIVSTCMLGIPLESFFHYLQLCHTKILSEMQPWFTKNFYLQQVGKKYFAYNSPGVHFRPPSPYNFLFVSTFSIIPTPPQGCILDPQIPNNFLFASTSPITTISLISHAWDTLYTYIFVSWPQKINGALQQKD